MGEMIILWVSEGARVGPGDACMLEKRERERRRVSRAVTAQDALRGRRLREIEREV